MTGCNEIKSLAELAELTCSDVIGDGDIRIAGVCSLDNPKTDHIAFVVDVSAIEGFTQGNQPAALIVATKVDNANIPLLINKNPRLAFTKVLGILYSDEIKNHGVHTSAWVADDADIDPTASIGPMAVIDSKAVIGPDVIIGAGTYVGHKSRIGCGTRLYPNVTVLHDVSIGERCIFHSGSVVGSDGFGFTPTPDGNMKVKQVGRIEIGNDVEVGANTTIDRATLDITVIDDDVKLDNLVQVAHNVKIGSHTRIAAQAGVAGRAVIEKNVVVGGQAGIQNGVIAGEGSVIAGRAGVTKNVPPGSTVSGFPARNHRSALLIHAAQNRLPEVLKRLDRIEKQLEDKE